MSSTALTRGVATAAVLIAAVTACSSDPGGNGGRAQSPSQSAGVQVTVRDDLRAVFDAAGMPGTFVLYNVDDNTITAVDKARAERPYVPASTFKIAHSLIALETGVVADENQKIPYRGQPQDPQEWQRDMGLREAIKLSNIPIYQEIARQVGLSAEREWLSRLGYGNADPGSVVDRFWLDGPLQISARDQVLWLRRLARHELPATVEHQKVVRDILQLEQSGGRTLFAKTGTVAGSTPQLGWWVGWVEHGAKLYCFALNLDLRTAADAPKRIELGRTLLDRLGVYRTS
jgi:beta-lactamase class D